MTFRSPDRRSSGRLARREGARIQFTGSRRYPAVGGLKLEPVGRLAPDGNQAVLKAIKLAEIRSGSVRGCDIKVTGPGRLRKLRAPPQPIGTAVVSASAWLDVVHLDDVLRLFSNR
jgi:hypothetical protein